MKKLIAAAVFIAGLGVAAPVAASPPDGCGSASEQSERFVRGDPPSAWFALPEQPQIHVVVSTFDTYHPQGVEQTGERVSVELNDGRIIGTTLDFPDSQVGWTETFGRHDRGDATEWRIVHAPDDENVTKDSVASTVTVYGCTPPETTTTTTTTTPPPDCDQPGECLPDTGAGTNLAVAGLLTILGGTALVAASKNRTAAETATHQPTTST
jgi:hypothetical protein